MYAAIMVPVHMLSQNWQTYCMLRKWQGSAKQGMQE